MLARQLFRPLGGALTRSSQPARTSYVRHLSGNTTTTAAAAAIPDQIDNSSTSSNSFVNGAEQAVDSAVLAAQEAALVVGDPLTLGNWPVDWVVRGLDYAHHTVGLEWWAAMALATLGARVLIVPLMIDSTRNNNRFTKAKPKIEQLQEEIKRHPDRKGQQVNLIKKVRDDHGFKFYKMFAPILIQAPVYSSFFFAAKRMAESHPSLNTGGTLWFTDLTVPDPYFVLPVLAGLSMVASVELGAANMKDASFNMRWGMRGMGAIIVPISAFLPSFVGVYFVSSGIGALGQALLFKTPYFARVTELPPPGAAAVSLPSDNITNVSSGKLFDAPPPRVKTKGKTNSKGKGKGKSKANRKRK